MLKTRIILIAAAALCITARLAVAAAPAPPPDTMYADAMAKEEAVRAALAAADAPATVLKAVRTVVADYEAIVRHYPSSGYCDDALWRASQLSLEAFRQFGEARERTASVRLLRTLAAEYPSSKWAKAAPPLVAVHAPQTLVSIKDIRRAQIPGGVRITIELDGEVPFYDEQLLNPMRVFVDLASTRASAGFIDRTIRFDGDANLVRQIRIGRHPNNTTRVVLDAIDIGHYSIYPMYAPFRLVIDCMRAQPDVVPAVNRSADPVPVMPAASIAAKIINPRAPAPPPAATPVAGAVLAEARETGGGAAATPLPRTPTAPPAAAATPAAPAAPPARNLAGGFSVARQLGLGVSRIVIDPGHGGHDPGAKGKGITEADLVLDVALRLEKLLQKVPGIEVILTRRGDEFVPLQERTAIANREGADLFLSIHANASNNTQARGIESYFLNFTTNQTAAAVAARENAASGQPMGALPDLLKTIALHSKVDESRDFATYVQRAMIERLKPANKTVRDLGVKQAPFVVLIGAAMPSVLAEISFVTNAQEVKLLRTQNYRQRIAEALFDAIRKYQSSLKTEATVAQQ